MSKNWREERKNARIHDTEDRVKEMRDVAKEDEKLIRALESPLLTVFSGPRGTGHYKGATVKTRGLSLSTPGDAVVVQVGTNGSVGDDSFTIISITGLLGEKSKFSASASDTHNDVELLFRGKDSLLQVSAVLRAIGAIFSEELMGSLKDSIAECAKEDAESRNGKKSKNGGKR